VNADDPAPTLDFRPGRVDEDPGAALVAAMRAEIAALYAGLVLDGADMPQAGPRELGPPGGRFLIGWLGEEPVCCGGLKRLDDQTCEIKRMYVVPQARGRGVARALLGNLEDLARELGYTVARLDSGDRQPHAIALYTSVGYREIENFNGNPAATYFAEKPLR
jgi:GNAT superfamily N-acetyltransferase